MRTISEDGDDRFNSGRFLLDVLGHMTSGLRAKRLQSSTAYYPKV
jgi:hypothetical protein